MNIHSFCARSSSLQSFPAGEHAPLRSIPPKILFSTSNIIIQDTEDRSTTSYEVRNEGSTTATLIVEHPLRSGWRLADGQKPAESAPGAERFRVTVEAGKEARLIVAEVSPGTAQVRVGDVTDALIAQLSASGVSADDLQRALRPVLDKKAEVAAIDRRLNELQAERTWIVEDQQRLRENMKALRGSAEERQLLQRYIRQLDEQESRLAALQEEAARATAERAAASAELSRLIGTVSFEWTGTSSGS